ncbi:MAG: coproporphyrinogen-III oxidase family protein [Bacteroidales bacterium]|nr:coproporphyrinogen-III oxidase family protein [Bacteroidales bacterium]
MAGIYIHIPFCRRKCHYCNFFSLASQKHKGAFLEALKKEILLTRDYLAGDPVNTIYFGGGTPSVYSPGELQEVVEMFASPSDEVVPKVSFYRRDAKAQRNKALIVNPLRLCVSADNLKKLPFDTTSRDLIPSNPEITLEVNPEDVTKGFVSELKGTWFNRFSLGVQSFSDEDLGSLNRSHSARQALLAVQLLQEAEYENISIDLIYGIPGASSARWKKNLEIAFSLGVPHISAYALTVEPKTPLAWMIDRHKSEPVNEEIQIDQFRILMEKTKEKGYLQYEISNFCKPGRHAVHNTNYWNGIPYLGLGPSAHSFNGTSRRWNISNLSKYIDLMDKGECIYEEEILTTVQKYNEYVMTSLRTMWGCESRKIISDFGFQISDFFRENALPMIGKGMLTEISGIYYLTDEGKLFADRVASELFLV